MLASAEFADSRALCWTLTVSLCCFVHTLTDVRRAHRWLSFEYHAECNQTLPRDIIIQVPQKMVSRYHSEYHSESHLWLYPVISDVIRMLLGVSYPGDLGMVSGYSLSCELGYSWNVTRILLPGAIPSREVSSDYLRGYQAGPLRPFISASARYVFRWADLMAEVSLTSFRKMLHISFHYYLWFLNICVKLMSSLEG